MHKHKLSGVGQLLITLIICSLLATVVPLLFDVSKNYLIPSINLIPQVLGSTVEFILFYINLFFMFSISLNKFGKSIYLALIGYLPLYIIVQWISPNTLVSSTLMPFIYIVVFGKIYSDGLATFTRSLLFLGLVAIYQMTSMYVRLGTFNLGYTEVDINTLSIYSIDLLLFYAIIYVYRRYSTYDKFKLNYSTNGWKHLIYSENFRIPRTDLEDQQIINQVTQLPRKDLAKVIIVATLFQLLQIVIIFTLCIIGGVWMECLIIMLGYLGATTVVKRRWHCSSVVVCTAVSALMFYVAGRSTIPSNISIIFSVIVGFLLAILLFLIDYTFNGD